MSPIGVFDSGYGGLTILSAIRHRLPQYDFLYLGDNARAPYGSRSFGVVYEFTREAVLHLFQRGCPLVILGCNTASAKALRSIQQHVLPVAAPDRRVLGVIRPTVEAVPELTRSRHVGLLATPGTVKSGSYDLEVQKLLPGARITAVACPLWAAIVEAGEAGTPGADYFVKKRIDTLFSQDPDIDTLILGCTHYPLLLDSIEKYVPRGVRVISQGTYVADSLADYLRRHADMEARLSRTGRCDYLTTESADKFSELSAAFLGHTVEATRVTL